MEILNWYGSDGVGTLTNLAPLLNHGRHPGSAHQRRMFETLRACARRRGLAVVVWAYPRGSGTGKGGNIAIDVIGYPAHIAAQLGPNIIRVKPLTAHVEQDDARKVYGEHRDHDA